MAQPVITPALHGLLGAGASLVALALTPAPAAAQGADGASLLLAPGALPDLVVDGELRHSGDRWEARGFSGRIGDVALNGSLAVDRSGAVPRLSGALEAPSFDVDAFTALLDELGLAGPDDDPSARLIPSFDLPTSTLHELEVDLDLGLTDISGLAASLRSVVTTISLESARLAFNPIDAEVAGGRITGESALNARHTPASADLVLDLESIDLAQLLQGTAAAEYLAGTVSGRLSLLGTGATLDQVLATSNGEASLVIEGGWVAGLALEAVGLDVVETLALYVGDSGQVPIDCGRLDVVVDEGVARIERLLVDTRDSLVLGDGTVTLGTEALDLTVHSRARDFSLIDLAAPIRIEGTLQDPSFAIGDVDMSDTLDVFDEARQIDCRRLLADDLSGEQ
jgi:uncharacterized protein involved in outer membrane biogenesis